MPPDIHEVLYAEEVVDALVDPTASDYARALQGHRPEVIGAVALERAESGGGGGDSLPDTGDLEEDSFLAAFLDTDFIPFWSPLGSLADNFDLEVTTNKGQPDGYAPLDGDGFVPVENLPAAANVALIPDPSLATPEDCANSINALITALTDAGLMAA